MPLQALAKLFRAMFVRRARRALALAAPSVRLPEVPWSKSWVVFAKPTVQGGERVLEYLGRYVHRTALAESALVATDERHVTFRYRDSRDHKHKTMTLPASEFLRRFLQHVPPKGFHRVRAFGLLHPHRRSELKRLQLLLASKTQPPTPRPVTQRWRAFHCCQCGEPALRLLRRLSQAECLARAAPSPAPGLRPASARAPPTGRLDVAPPVAS